MTFESKEYSVADAEPFELYDFICGTWLMYLTTKATEFFVSSAQIYEPTSLKRSKIRQSEEIRKDLITITIPRGHDLTSQFIHYPPENSMSITIRRMHRDLTFSDAKVMWKGRVIAGEPKGEVYELSCESIYTSMRRQGPRLRCELICQHVLYDEYCKANKPSMRFDNVIVSIDDSVLTMTDLSGYADGWFTGGTVEYETESRYILSHVGNTIKVSRPLVSLLVNTEVALYAGCDRTRSTCKNKFNNLDNNLSFADFPAKNPFEVSIA